jgi:hypothetical protein
MPLSSGLDGVTLRAEQNMIEFTNSLDRFLQRFVQPTAHFNNPLAAHPELTRPAVSIRPPGYVTVKTKT